MSKKKTQKRTTRTEVPVEEKDTVEFPVELRRALYGFTAAGLFVVTLVIVAYARWGGPFVLNLTGAIGDVVMDEAVRLEKAGETEDAIAKYAEAIQNRFMDSRKRTESLARLGNLLLWKDGAAKGLPYLEEAYSAGNYGTGLYEPLCQALLGVGRTDEALRRAQEWFDAIVTTRSPEKQAVAKLIQGRCHRALGHTDAALQAFIEADNIKPGGANAYYAGVLSFETGKKEQALKYLDRYLLEGTGENIPNARTLRDRTLAGQTAGRG